MKSEEDSLSVCVEEAYVDCRGRPFKSNSKHGGLTSALFVLVFQGLEMMSIAAVGNNLITYVYNEMHYPLSKSANIVTNFVGTTFLLSLLGGFLSDSYLGSFWTIFIFGFLELLGFILLAIQAGVGELRPARCKMGSEECEVAKGYKALILFIALYMVGIGSGCLKPNIISHGAHQLKKKESKKLSTFFNAAYFAFCMGEFMALTLLVWVQTNSGMDVGFAVSAATMALALIIFISASSFYHNNHPQGSIFTPIAQVLVAAIRKRQQICPSNPNMLHGNLLRTQKLRFLDKACIKIQDGRESNESPWRLCTFSQVQQVKILISLIPIFACTIIFNTILAQLQTFSVQQGSIMNISITTHFQIPPASLQSIPYFILIFLVPLYQTTFVPFARKITKNDSGISPLQRVGIGLFVATFSMVSAAVVEKKRRTSQLQYNHKLSIFWIAPQFLIFGVSEMFTAVGLIEFFYKQSLEGMQSFLTAMTYCSYSFGFYLSSILVSLVNKISSTLSDHRNGWLSRNDLNKDRLDLFYWLLAGLSLINFVGYIFCSRWYSSLSITTTSRESRGEEMENESFMNSRKRDGPHNIACIE